MKKSFLLFILMSIMVTSCWSTSTPTVKTSATATNSVTPAPIVVNPTSTPIPSPTAFQPFWKDLALIDSQLPVVISNNDTQEWVGREIYGSEISLDTDVRITINIKVDNLVPDMEKTNTGIMLMGYTKEGQLQAFILVYEWGHWSVGYQPYDWFKKPPVFWHSFENLKDPHERFELTFSGDRKSFLLTNDEGLEFHHTMEEQFFEGAQKIAIHSQVTPQTQITLSELIVSHLQKYENVNASALPADFIITTPVIEDGEPQTVLHVAINGNDNNPGTLEQPFATIKHARDVVQRINSNMQGSIIVMIHGGTYSISEPVIFTENDSGQNGFDVIYLAAEGETPIFSGGINIRNWEKLPDSQLWKTTLQNVKTFRQMYINGVRAQRASSTNTVIGYGWKSGDFSDRDGISISSALIPNFSRPQDLELHWIYDWKDMRLLVRDVENYGGASTIWMKQPYYLYALWMGGENESHPWFPKYNVPFYLENAIELLDEPGEWYFNPDSNELFYLPREGEDMYEANVIIPQTELLFDISGGPVGQEVHNIVFDGLSFEYAGWTRASEIGVYGWQAQNLIAETGWEEDMTPAHIQVNSARDIRIERCRFEHLGAVGLHLNNNVFDITVQGNLFHDISDGAIAVGHWDHAYITSPLVEVPPNNNLIANNLISDIGVDYWGAPAITAYYVSNLHINHNEVSDVPYGGISVGWGWIYTIDSTTSHDNLVTNNLITDIIQRARDSGGIYTLGQQPGTVIEGNVVRRVKGDPACFYLDEGSAFITVYNNVCDSAPNWLNIWTDSIHDNRIDNTFTNVFIMKNNGINNKIENTIYIDGQNWTPEAQAIIDNAGLELEFSYLYDWFNE